MEDRNVRRGAWWPYVVGVLSLVLFINNGLWQLRRYDQKLAQQTAFDAATNSLPVTRWEQLEAPQRVVLRGAWQADATVFLDNHSYQGRPGFYVLTPLRLVGGGGTAMVNRGWVAAGPDRRRLPAIPTPAGVVEVAGRVLEPVLGGFSLGESTAEPGIWQRIDPQRFKALVGGPVATVYVQQEGVAADGLVRDWPRPDFGAGKHMSYAWQWFAFAVMTIGWMLWFGWHKYTKSRT